MSAAVPAPSAAVRNAVSAALRAAGHAALPAGPPSPEGDLILGGGSFVDLQDGKTPRHVLSRVDLATQRVGLTATGFLPHGIALDPLDANRVVVCEKIGPGCCEIDLASGRLTRTIAPQEDRWFYGHGAFSPDGRLLYTTETVNSRESGVIGVRDARTLAYLGEFPTFGENPHDCRLSADGRTLVVTNGGGRRGTPMRPCVTYVDVEARRLLDKVEPDDERVNAGHLALSDEGVLVVVSAPRKGMRETDLGGVSLRRARGPLHVASEPGPVVQRMVGEALSVEIHEPTGVAAVTHPFGEMVTFWSLAEQKLLTTLELPRARGLALSRDGRHFVLSYGATADLDRIDPRTWKRVPGGLSRSFLTGSHLFNWNRLAAREVDRAPASRGTSS
jgi:hypothetical protein